jgi:hypothetical protein
VRFSHSRLAGLPTFGRCSCGLRGLLPFDPMPTTVVGPPWTGPSWHRTAGSRGSSGRYGPRSHDLHGVNGNRGVSPTWGDAPKLPLTWSVACCPVRLMLPRVAGSVHLVCTWRRSVGPWQRSWRSA